MPILLCNLPSTDLIQSLTVPEDPLRRAHNICGLDGKTFLLVTLFKSMTYRPQRVLAVGLPGTDLYKVGEKRPSN